MFKVWIDAVLKPWIDRKVWRLTARIWNRRIIAVLCHHYHKGTITGHQLHVLAAEFDPTQRGLKFE